ncbi:hypothetical protein ACIBHY_28770 [Nonomuraea sp. NPDC050547]|uniref:hypothetical protein n=1 Tax=Nonomuraea sp. NPDC050547 TaxID=3364368 RepID=UPI0037B2D710
MRLRDIIPADQLPDPAARFPDLWYTDEWQARFADLAKRRWTRGQVNGCLLLNDRPMIPYEAWPYTKSLAFGPLAPHQPELDFGSAEWQAVLRRYHQRGFTYRQTAMDLHLNGIPLVGEQAWMKALAAETTPQQTPTADP